MGRRANTLKEFIVSHLVYIHVSIGSTEADPILKRSVYNYLTFPSSNPSIRGLIDFTTRFLRFLSHPLLFSYSMTMYLSFTSEEILHSLLFISLINSLPRPLCPPPPVFHLANINVKSHVGKTHYRVRHYTATSSTVFTWTQLSVPCSSFPTGEE